MEHDRKSLRLPFYDYSNGVFFITLCTDSKHFLFGQIADGAMIENPVGKIVHEEWLRTGSMWNRVCLDQFVIMPNHFHAIFAIDGSQKGVPQAEFISNVGANCIRPFKSPKEELSSVIRGFKASVTKRVREMVKVPDMIVWQRGYYDHIVRSERDLRTKQQYIFNNPMQWSLDEYY